MFFNFHLFDLSNGSAILYHVVYIYVSFIIINIFFNRRVFCSSIYRVIVHVVCLFTNTIQYTIMHPDGQNGRRVQYKTGVKGIIVIFLGYFVCRTLNSMILYFVCMPLNPRIFCR